MQRRNIPIYRLNEEVSGPTSEATEPFFTIAHIVTVLYNSTQVFQVLAYSMISHSSFDLLTSLTLP